MNLGDGLLFELENGKPKLTLLSHGIEKNPAKLSRRPRLANILSSRQLSCMEELQREQPPARHQPGKHRETKNRIGGAVTPTSTVGRSGTLTSSKTHEHHKVGSVKIVAKVKSDSHKHSTTVGSLRANEKTGQSQNSGTPSSGVAGVKDSVVCQTNEQLQQILNTAQSTSTVLDPAEDHRTQGNQTVTKSSMNDDVGRRQGKEEDGGGATDTTVSSQDKDKRSGCMFGCLRERQSESRATINAKKAQWRRELDEQVILKQQQRQQRLQTQQHWAPNRFQAEEDTESVLSVQSSVSHREQPAAIRSSLRLGEVTPMEEVLNHKRNEEQRRRWLEELDKQREETTERRRREKLLQNQAEDHELWTTHFDSMQRRPPVQTTAPSAPSVPPPAPSNASERGEWEPSSSLSLVWEAMSSSGGESVGRVSVDPTSGYQTKTSHLRTMTALLDPTQIEERERRKLKQQEQQRAIEAQVEERRRQRELEQMRTREEEEQEDRRLAQEREMLKRRYEQDTCKARQKAQQPSEGHNNSRHQGTLEPVAPRQGDCLEEVSSSASTYKDTAVQTEAAPSVLLSAGGVQPPHLSAQLQPPPPVSNVRNRAVRAGKENICLPGGRGGGRGGGGGGGGGDPYTAFARTENNRRDRRRPEWNTQRPRQQFVPASERYPASLQKNRQESRMKRQTELLALQERSLSKINPPPPLLHHQGPPLCSNHTQTRISSTRRGENVSRGYSSSSDTNTERGRSPPVPAVRHRVQTQQAQPPSTSLPPPPPPVLEFIPYVRTDEVFNLDPLEPAGTPPPHTDTPPKSSAPPLLHRDPLLHHEPLCNTPTPRQQEILRVLGQLRQGLLQKQRELERDLNPLLRRCDHELR